MRKWYHTGWTEDPSTRSRNGARYKFNDGMEVYYNDEKFYVWCNPLNGIYILCKDKKDIGITGRKLMTSELDNVYGIDEWRNYKLGEIGI